MSKTKYVCVFATRRDDHLMENYPISSHHVELPSNGEVDGYVSIFFRNESEALELPEDICDALYAHGLLLADENNVELEKGQLQTFMNLMNNDPVISTLVSYDPDLQKQFANDGESVYSYEYPETIEL